MDVQATAGVVWDSLDIEGKAAWIAWWRIFRQPEYLKARGGHG